MGALPRLIVNRSKHLRVKRRARKWEHWYRLAAPDTVRLQVFLPAAYLAAFIVLGQNEICLDPGDTLARIDQQFREALGTHAAALVKLVASGIGDGFDSALQRDAVRTSKQVQRLFVPQ